MSRIGIAIAVIVVCLFGVSALAGIPTSQPSGGVCYLEKGSVVYHDFTTGQQTMLFPFPGTGIKGPFAISDDGKILVYVDGNKLFLRRAGNGGPTPIVIAEDIIQPDGDQKVNLGNLNLSTARNMCLSPDGRFLAFQITDIGRVWVRAGTTVWTVPRGGVSPAMPGIREGSNPLPKYVKKDEQLNAVYLIDLVGSKGWRFGHVAFLPPAIPYFVTNMGSTPKLLDAFLSNPDMIRQATRNPKIITEMANREVLKASDDVFMLAGTTDPLCGSKMTYADYRKRYEIVQEAYSPVWQQDTTNRQILVFLPHYPKGRPTLTLPGWGPIQVLKIEGAADARQPLKFAKTDIWIGTNHFAPTAGERGTWELMPGPIAGTLTYIDQFAGVYGVALESNGVDDQDSRTGNASEIISQMLSTDRICWLSETSFIYRTTWPTHAGLLYYIPSIADYQRWRQFMSSNTGTSQERECPKQTLLAGAKIPPNFFYFPTNPALVVKPPEPRQASARPIPAAFVPKP